MQSTAARVATGVVAVAAVIVLFVVLQGDGGDEPSPPADSSQVNPPQTPDAPKPEKPKPDPEVAMLEVKVEGAAPVGDVQEFELDKGEKAELIVTSSDTTDHVHLHGYDLIADLAPGQPAKIEFTADIEGQFEAELEESVVPIAELTVNP
jgi:heme/copper-type cytochrome/quinol oxidase subunit 2